MQPGGACQCGERVTVEQVLAHRNGRPQTADLADSSRGQPTLHRAQVVDLLEAPAGFMVQRIEHQRSFAGAGHAGHHGETVRKGKIDIFEVVFAGALNDNRHTSSPWKSDRNSITKRRKLDCPKRHVVKRNQITSSSNLKMVWLYCDYWKPERPDYRHKQENDRFRNDPDPPNA